jgi:hypothetical protein
MNRPRMLVAVALFATASAVAAITFEGTTVGGPTWQRPVEGAPPTSLSGIATAVPYVSTPFSVTVGGTYVFVSQTTVPVIWDNFTLLYQGSFAAASPLANVLLGDDDFTNTAGMSGFTSVLTAGTSYFFVTTGFGNSDDGAFSNSIIGPGRVVLPGPVFADGFETGTFIWSVTQP